MLRTESAAVVSRSGDASRAHQSCPAGRAMSLATIAMTLTSLWVAPAEAAETWTLTPSQREAALRVLRDGLRSEEFWPSMHAAEGLTLAGQSADVLRELPARLREESDDQKRCGLARELARAGQRQYVQVLLDVLRSDDPHGHVHAAESLFKVGEVGDGRRLREVFERSENVRLQLMAAAALARCGNLQALARLRAMVHDPDDSIARIAVWVLARIGNDQDVPAIRQRMQTVEDRVDRCFFEHAMAALGAVEGREQLLENLDSKEPAVRTYAATFAGDARVLEARESLLRQLEDENLDARIRAAQTLLQLEHVDATDRGDDRSLIVFQATREHPRYTEGSILELNDGSLEFAVTEFQGRGSDFDGARIVARRSADGGRSWSLTRVLQKNTGARNVMSVTLRRMPSAQDPARIGVFYLEKNSVEDLDLRLRFSTDELQTLSESRLVTESPGYHVVNNDRVLQLSSGRWLVPAASTADVRKVNHFVARCLISDDDGASWRASQGQVDLPKRGAMEPDLLELKDGRVLMILRNQLGSISRSVSADGGETWSEPDSLGLKAPEAPATIRRIPATGDVVLIWNNTWQPNEGHGGARTPLTIAVSKDDGDSWEHVQNLETRTDRTFSYASATFVGSRIVLSYWESEPRLQGLSCRFRSFPVQRLYTGLDQAK